MEYVQFEASYRKFIEDLNYWCPDGVISIDIELLKSLDLLEEGELREDRVEWLNLNFHVVESVEKITLFNDEFVVWVVPRIEEEQALTYTIVARHCDDSDEPDIELVYSAKGVYNEPHYILRVLGGFLMEIQETDSLLSDLAGND